MKRKTDPAEGLHLNSGQVLTPELLDELAAEAERGYDLSKAKRVKVGRPSLGSGVSPRVSFRLRAGDYEIARAEAQAGNTTISELARAALDAYLARAQKATRQASRGARGRRHSGKLPKAMVKRRAPRAV